MQSEFRWGEAHRRIKDAELQLVRANIIALLAKGGDQATREAVLAALNECLEYLARAEREAESMAKDEISRSLEDV